MASRVNSNGLWVPPESLFAETTGYQAQAGAIMVAAGIQLTMPEVVSAGQRVMDRIVRIRLADGLWSLGWCGEVTYPTSKPITRRWREQNTVADPRYSAIALIGLGRYTRATGDMQYCEAANESMHALFERWDWTKQTDVLHLTREMVALSVLAWSGKDDTAGPMSWARPRVEPIVQWVRSTYVSLAAEDFAFQLMFRTQLLLLATSDEADRRELAEHTLIPGLERFLAAPRWRFPDRPNDFRHIPDTDDHINTRGNTAVALTLRLIDTALGEPRYTSQPLYQHLTAWIDGQRHPEGGWYEAQDLTTGRKFGRSSPGQYLPLYWIMGGLGG